MISSTSVSVTFAVVASRTYTDHAAGLVVNLREFYPDSEIVICALDSETEQAFTQAHLPNVTCVTASDVWGPAYWKNVTCRMSVAERAFATKAALTEWVVKKRNGPVLLLDSDLLLLDSIDDIINQLNTKSLLLVPARHPWINWRKSAQFGLFSAGFLAANTGALPGLHAWKLMCFAACTASRLGGIYYEQKYLDYLVTVDCLCILKDPGINVSQTLLKLLAPKKIANGCWVLNDGTPLRIYHCSRSTDDRLELAELKRAYNRMGLKRLGISVPAMQQREVRIGNRFGFSALTRFMRIGSLLDLIALLLSRFSLNLIVFHRVFTLSEHSLLTRFLETFSKRRTLIASLTSEKSQENEPSAKRD